MLMFIPCYYFCFVMFTDMPLSFFAVLLVRSKTHKSLLKILFVLVLLFPFPPPIPLSRYDHGQTGAMSIVIIQSVSAQLGSVVA